MEPIDNNNTVWVVTGTSSGLGLSLIKLLLDQGYKVAALTRKPENIQLENHKSNLLIVKTDITNDTNVKESIESIVKHFGHIDIVVNNAGYGLAGAIEEINDYDIRKIYDVNVFGVLNILRHTTKYLRQQKSGTIINVSSLLGWDNLGLYSAYSSTKHAVNSLTFSAQKELAPFNVKVILASPGGLKTTFVSGDSESTNFQVSKDLIQEYNTTQLVEVLNQYAKLANGDPDKAAQVLIDLTKLDQPPNNLFIGSDSLAAAISILSKHLKETEKYSDISKSSDFELKSEIPTLI